MKARFCFVCGTPLEPDAHGNRRFCASCARRRITDYKARWYLAKVRT